MLKVGLGAPAAALWPGKLFAAGYRVGVGRGADPYGATRRALTASGEWPAPLVSGKRVVIKPNLVSPRAASSGLTTDPEVVRAVVDQALADGAAAVQIIESAPQGAFFSECGYDFFRTYDPFGRVQLVDVHVTRQVLAPVDQGLAYGAIYVPELLFGDPVFVSVGKLKTHIETAATLALKNLFGLPATDRYLSFSVAPSGRFAMHDRSANQTVVDLNRLRPVHFAVVDGMWGMEGNGPLNGDPVRMDTVLAGHNALAVDRVAAALMRMSQRAVRHLDYAAQAGLGPMELEEITVAGDPVAPRAFAPPWLPPYVEYPRVSPAVFNPSARQTTTIGVYYAQTCLRALDVRRLYDDRPAVDVIRTLAPWGTKPQGYEFVTWDGRSDDGTLAPPGRYAAHVRAYQPTGEGRPIDGVGWVWVVA